jgi:nanoRNase/pAp phosphatase (c-di-AMP/oligoRNAs hydrolase)
VLPERVEQLFEAVAKVNKLLILPHNNPDPDAIASAVALRYLLEKNTGITCQIAFRGIIGRAENKMLIHYLGDPLQRLTSLQLEPETPFALVDTQPGAGNNALPTQANVAIVIDHHPWREATMAADFFDVRPHVGSTSSILVEYLHAADLEMEPPLATALFYGIKTDTLGLGRGTNTADTLAICSLLSLIDIEALLKIERAQVPIDYFKSFAATLQTARIYNGVVISYIGSMDYPDLAAEMADFLLRIEGSQWIICQGVYEDRLILSVRTHYQRGAGHLVQSVIGERGVAGGHGSMAGGQVMLNGEDPKQLADYFSQRALAHLNVSPEEEGQPLLH